jgi:hypothetical protein
MRLYISRETGELSGQANDLRFAVFGFRDLVHG